MKAGELDQRVTLQRREQGEDEAGQPFDAWVNVATVWAAVRPLRANDLIRADALTNIMDVKVTLRYRPGITSAMKVTHGADTYRIESVVDVKSGRRELELLCKRVA